jgi:hypothetical protein
MSSISMLVLGSWMAAPTIGIRPQEATRGECHHAVVGLTGSTHDEDDKMYSNHVHEMPNMQDMQQRGKLVEENRFIALWRSPTCEVLIIPMSLMPICCQLFNIIGNSNETKHDHGQKGQIE